MPPPARHVTPRHLPSLLFFSPQISSGMEAPAEACLLGMVTAAVTACRLLTVKGHRHHCFHRHAFACQLAASCHYFHRSRKHRRHLGRRGRLSSLQGFRNGEMVAFPGDSHSQPSIPSGAASHRAIIRNVKCVSSCLLFSLCQAARLSEGEHFLKAFCKGHFSLSLLFSEAKG